MINRLSRYKAIHYMAVLLTGCFFLSCENDQRVLDAWTERRVLVEEGKNIESYLSQGGQLRAKLIAPKMIRYTSDTVYAEFPNTLKVDFYDENTLVESWLSARYGKYFEQQNKVYLRDSVMVINRDGDTLRTPELWWDQSKQLFYTDQPARLDGRDKHLVGKDGLEATQDLRSIIFKMPRGSIQAEQF